jgi:hypothetical protein
MSVRKADALLRDLAALFIKYSLSEWHFVLEELRDGGKIQRDIAKAIEEIYDIKQRSLAKGRELDNKPVRRDKVNAAAKFINIANIDPNRAPIVLGLIEALQNRRLLPTAGGIRDIYSSLGGKGSVPEKRDAAIRFIVSFIAQLPTEQFERALKAVVEHKGSANENLRGDYSRWFDIIYGRSTGSDEQR